MAVVEGGSCPALPRKEQLYRLVQFGIILSEKRHFLNQIGENQSHSARLGHAQSGLQIAPNLLIHSGLFLMRFARFPNDFNADVGLLISGSKVRALVRPPSKPRSQPVDKQRWERRSPGRESLTVGLQTRIPAGVSIAPYVS
jgi:hypothetical protein